MRDADDEAAREARVELDDNEVDLAKLAGLLQSGLSGAFTVEARGTGIDVVFTVDPALDQAV